jgi:hypothetical protein
VDEVKPKKTETLLNDGREVFESLLTFDNIAGTIFYRRSHMASAVKTAGSYTIDKDVKDYIDETKGELSASQRANELLNAAIEREQLDALARQARQFFGDPRNADRENARAFQKSAIRVQARD